MTAVYDGGPQSHRHRPGLAAHTNASRTTAHFPKAIHFSLSLPVSRLALTDMDLSRSLGDMRKQAAELCRTGDWEAALVLHEVLRQENSDSFCLCIAACEASG